MQTSQPNVLVLRFSALGDILMTVPVLQACALQHPEVRFTVVSRPYVGKVFALLPSNVEFVGIDPRGYKGVAGLWRLYRQLAELRPTSVADLHDVLRTKVLRMCFRLFSRMPVRHIVKNRKARRNFIEASVKTQQCTSFERYAAVFEDLGLRCPLNDVPAPVLLSDVAKRPAPSVGIAPFAAHEGKIYPLPQMEQVVSLLAAKGIEVFLFGAGAKERAICEKWAATYPGVTSVVGTLGNMGEELRLIASLHAMLTMDSGNMHLAALTSTPVVSIWGATHHLGGFRAWRSSVAQVIDRPELSCRPCSTYGNRPCRYGDYRCLTTIAPEQVVERVLRYCSAR